MAEWVVAAFGLVLVVGAVAFLLYQEFAVEAEPPDVVLQAGETIKSRQGYLVLVTVRNEGGQTAAGLTISGSLEDDSGVVETSETTLDYLPPHSEREAGLLFSESPEAYRLTLRAEGYQRP